MNKVEFELYDLYKNMMIMMFFFSLLVLIMGKMGVRVTKVKKAAVAHSLFKKSVILLIPFLLVVISLKG